jgi:predicted lipoprotein
MSEYSNYMTLEEFKKLTTCINKNSLKLKYINFSYDNRIQRIWSVSFVPFIGKDHVICIRDVKEDQTLFDACLKYVKSVGWHD